MEIGNCQSQYWMNGNLADLMHTYIRSSMIFNGFGSRNGGKEQWN